LPLALGVPVIRTHFSACYPALRLGALVFVCVLIVLTAVSSGNTASADATFEVDSTSDANLSACTVAPDDCSLRGAINASNAAAGTDTITFNIPAATDAGCNAGTAVCTFAPLTDLPAISGAVIVEGYSQPGAVMNPQLSAINAVLKIELAGTNLGTESIGLRVNGGGSTIRGLVVNRFATGIEFSNSGNNFLLGNYIGTNVEGTAALGNGTSQSSPTKGGVRITGTSSNNTIGGTSPSDRNLISGNNNFGVLLESASNVIRGNLVGPDKSGEVDITSQIVFG
jgi:hypothetical protein